MLGAISRLLPCLVQVSSGGHRRWAEAAKGFRSYDQQARRQPIKQCSSSSSQLPKRTQNVSVVHGSIYFTISYCKLVTLYTSNQDYPLASERFTTEGDNQKRLRPILDLPPACGGFQSQQHTLLETSTIVSLSPPRRLPSLVA